MITNQDKLWVQENYKRLAAMDAEEKKEFLIKVKQLAKGLNKFSTSETEQDQVKKLCNLVGFKAPEEIK